MNITIKPEHERFIQTQIANGQFANVDEVVDTALRLLEKLSHEYADWVEETREKVDVAVAELDRGEGLDGEIVVNRILDRFRQAKESSQ